MQAIKTIIITVIILAIALPVSADIVGSQMLIEQGKLYDNKSIEYKGEVIGDIMRRGDYAWINVSDGSNAIGVWVMGEEVDKITYSGKYMSQGDIVLIKGLFHRACSQHGGDMDIHADEVVIIEKGYEREIPFEYNKLIYALVFLISAVILYISTRYKQLI